MGFAVVMVSETETNLGAVLSFEEAQTCARIFRANQDRISGIIVILPNFGEELGIAEAIDRADLHVPVLLAGYKGKMPHITKNVGVLSYTITRCAGSVGPRRKLISHV